MSRDPIGFQGGNANLYVYVMNDPINNTDPSGNVVLDNTGITKSPSFTANPEAMALLNSLQNSPQIITIDSGQSSYGAQANPLDAGNSSIVIQTSSFTSNELARIVFHELVHSLQHSQGLPMEEYEARLYEQRAFGKTNTQRNQCGGVNR